MSTADCSWLLRVVRGCSTSGVVSDTRGCGWHHPQNCVHHVLVKRRGGPILVVRDGVLPCDCSVILHVATIFVTQDISPFVEKKGVYTSFKVYPLFIFVKWIVKGERVWYTDHIIHSKKGV